MDEATSALDLESEKIILSNMAQITKNRTTFIIAHRLTAVRNCDIILVMDKGHIIEAGSHSELIKNKRGYYNFLYNQQAFNNDNAGLKIAAGDGANA